LTVAVWTSWYERTRIAPKSRSENASRLHITPRLLKPFQDASVNFRYKRLPNHILDAQCLPSCVCISSPVDERSSNIPEYPSILTKRPRGVVWRVVVSAAVCHLRGGPHPRRGRGRGCESWSWYMIGSRNGGTATLSFMRPRFPKNHARAIRSPTCGLKWRNSKCPAHALVWPVSETWTWRLVDLLARKGIVENATHTPPARTQYPSLMQTTKDLSKPFRSSRRGKCAFKAVDGFSRGCISASGTTKPQAPIPGELVPRNSFDRLQQPHC
jgi:hypothetical protein